MTTLVFVFKKIESEDKTKCDTFYLKSTTISKIQKSLGKAQQGVHGGWKSWKAGKMVLFIK